MKNAAQIDRQESIGSDGNGLKRRKIFSVEGTSIDFQGH
jgi:hypothetical protein